jgi:Sulfotransferase family
MAVFESMNGVGPRPGDGRWTGASADPVFVLCAARSGSTLLRFILDAHPDLACPPETNVPALCGQLATVWSLIAGAPLSANRGDEPPVIPDATIAGVRETMDRMVGSYLARREKKRYCDKSLGTARFADLVTRVWPEARFICLYRHPMDVIASGMEACPWGLTGYGFEPYAAATPGNAVLALARFWADNAAGIAAAEQQYAGRCHRVRYEDMVRDPQAVADSIFGFLAVPPVADIARQVFAAERERFGPADYKIWHTSRITGESVGRGWDVPADMIPPPERARINALASQLGYAPVDEGWGTADQPADLRTDAPTAAGPSPAEAAEVADVAAMLREHVTGRLARLGEEFAVRWQPYSTGTFQLVITPDGSGSAGRNARWLVNVAAATLAPADPDADDPDADDDGGWDIVGTASAWRQVIEGSLNLSVAMRRNMLRHCDSTDAGPVIGEMRVTMLADVLGLTSWSRSAQLAPMALATGGVLS